MSTGNDVRCHRPPGKCTSTQSETPHLLGSLEPENRVMINVGEDAGKLELSRTRTASANVKWSRHFRKQFGSSSK